MRRAWTRGEALRLAALLLLVAAWTTAWSHDSGWSGDDVLNFAQAQERPFGWGLMKLQIYQHFAPGHRFLDWVIVQLGPPSWAFAFAMMVVMLVVVLALFYAVLRELLGPRPLLLVAVAVFGFSPVWVRVTEWWANAAHVLPAMCFGLGAVLCALRWRAGRRPVTLAAALLCFAAALMFYSLAVLYPVVFAGLAYLVQTREGVRGTLRALWTDRLLWLPLVVIGIVYLIYVRNGPYYEGTPSPTGAQWSAYLRAKWLRGIAPLALESHIPLSTDALDEVLVVAAQAVLLAFVAWALLADRRTWRPLAFGAAIIAITTVVVGAGRIAQFGLDPAYDLRYHVEGLLGMLLGGTIAAGWALDAGLGRVRAVLAPACVAAGVVLAVLAARAAHDIQSAEFSGLNHFISRLRDTTADLRARGLQPTLLDSPMPDGLVPAFNQPYNRVSTLARVFVLGYPKPFLDGGTLAFANPDGTLQQARLSPVRRLGVAGLIRRRVVPQRPDAQGCYGPGPGTIELVPSGFPGEDIHSARVLELRPAAGTTPSGQLGVWIGTAPSPQYIAGVDTAVALRRGLQLAFTPGMDIARLDFGQGARLCLSSATLRVYG